MSKPLKLYASIENGELNFQSPEWVREKMGELKDGQYVLTLEKYFGQRTSQQNRYFHGIVVPLVFEGLRNHGWEDIKDERDAKKYLKSKFLKRVIVNPETGEEAEIIRDTHELSTVEMSQLWEDIAQWCSEYLGFALPEPNSQSKLFAV